ncbi:MAG: hypothetical protein QG639_227 [Patescibacteria group bacterium]|jgi:uncharacterized membrane protein|nr:hypothetical protein [Patescibacteria group bacterium]
MKNLTKLAATLGVSLISLQTAAVTAFAQITNPPIGQWGQTDGAAGGGLFARYFITMWNAVISIGAIAVLAYFIWGAVEWITSAGDSAKLQSSRNRMLHAIIGLFLLVTAYTIIGFLSELIFGEDFNILRPVFFIPS